MRTELRHSRVLRCCMLLSICALLVGLFPAHPARAAINKTLQVDNGLADFSRGTFLRSALSTMLSSNSKVKDVRGAVQISPVGVIKDWHDSAIPLPIPLQRMGTAVYGNRVFVIGGQTNLSGSLRNVGRVWSNTVAITTGALLKPQWDAEPPLNALKSRVNDTRAYSETSQVAVTLINRPGNQGAYLYVIGGNVAVGTVSFSSYTARLGTIDSSGRISGWTALPDIPGWDGSSATQNGLEAASAVNFTINGKTYLYVLGGEEAYYSGSGGTGQDQVVRATRQVYYAEVGSNGRIFKPGTNQQTEGWTVMSSAPIPDLSDASGETKGLFDATAMAVSGASDFENALYLIGGQRVSQSNRLGTSPSYTSLVRRGTIQGDGTILWSGDDPPIMDVARFGMGGVAYRGKVYLTGGRTGSGTNPSQTIQTSEVTDNMGLELYGTTNFLPSDTIPEARMWHTSPVVGNDSGTGFVYVMGGRAPAVGGGTPTEASLVSDKIFFAKIGGEEDLSKGYSFSGRYYSAAFPIVFEGAEVKEINWSTVITPGTNTDIRVSFRTSNANDCSNPGWTESDWRDMTSTEAGSGLGSANGINTFPIGQQIIAKCFQYKAVLFSGATSGSSIPNVTPTLLNLGIIVRVPGSPDLKVKSTANDPNAFTALYNQKKQFVGFSVKLINHNDQTTAPDNVTQDAAAENGGTFFVNLYIFKPGETPVAPTLPPTGSSPEPTACVQIDKSFLPANGEYSIPVWYVSDDSCDKTVYDFRSVFTTSGTYKVYVAVDTDCFGNGNDYGCVNEKDALNGETNNVSGPIDVVIPSGVTNPVGIPDLYLPLMKRFAK